MKSLLNVKLTVVKLKAENNFEKVTLVLRNVF